MNSALVPEGEGIVFLDRLQQESPISEKRLFNLHILSNPHLLLRLQGRAMKLTQNSSDAEDLLQETLARAWRYRDNFQVRTDLVGGLSAWLLRMMKNLYLNRVMVRAEVERKRAQRFDGDQDGALFQIAAPDGTPEDHLLGRIDIDHITAGDIRTLKIDGFAEEIMQIIRSMYHRFARLLILIDVLEYTYQEAADRLEIRIGTVMSGVHRAREAFKEKLLEQNIGRQSAEECELA